jgi:hypothetical protein
LLRTIDGMQSIQAVQEQVAAVLGCER